MENEGKLSVYRISKRGRRYFANNKKIIAPFLFFVIFILIWELLIQLFNIQIIILPSPSAVFFEIIDNIALLLYHTLFTSIESISGFIIANLLAFFLAILFAYSKYFEKGLYPYAIALKTTPIVAMAPILIMWFGSGISSKIVASALICFFPMLVNTTKGLKSIDEESLDLFESLGASKVQIFRKLRLPYSLPHIFSALKISTSLSVVGAIVGEFVGSDKGLGYIIVYSSYHFEMARMFAAVMFSAFIGVFLFSVVTIFENKFSYWESIEIE